MKMLEKFVINNEEESANRFKLKKNQILQKIDRTNKIYLKATGLPIRSAVQIPTSTTTFDPSNRILENNKI
jgi:hypothetical protein